MTARTVHSDLSRCSELNTSDVDMALRTVELGLARGELDQGQVLDLIGLRSFVTSGSATRLHVLDGGGARCGARLRGPLTAVYAAPASLRVCSSCRRWSP